ncbi:nedd8-specific protease-like protein [Podospora aff. communis PSN243]|uniref:Nedd8-specific protease-like protein n=1 Tax=Podospora aff. communis PSN243 TaxID=3040156 RepID=A0AAV9H2W9_9PEZI|nr:nedd8-specific protease-like protein [Podospora aff. communis PSN243]
MSNFKSTSRFQDNLHPPHRDYLTYYTVTLTYADISALRDDWLTDNNITFWQEWLEREVLPKYPEARIELMRPSMAFLLMQSLDLKGITANLPDVKKKTHIFLPINDQKVRGGADSGTHWSLLLVSCIDGVAFHYDSMGGANFLEAQKCADRLGKVLGQALRFHQMEDTPQQENSSDCGVYVCILMRHLLIKRLLNANANEKVSMSMRNKLIDAKGGRKEMLKIIESLRKEGERRRSASPYARTVSPAGAPRIVD